jgi:hypothetical protein
VPPIAIKAQRGWATLLILFGLMIKCLIVAYAERIRADRDVNRNLMDALIRSNASDALIGTLRGSAHPFDPLLRFNVDREPAKPWNWIRKVIHARGGIRFFWVAAAMFVLLDVCAVIFVICQ